MVPSEDEGVEAAMASTFLAVLAFSKASIQAYGKNVILYEKFLKRELRKRAFLASLKVASYLFGLGISTLKQSRLRKYEELKGMFDAS